MVIFKFSTKDLPEGNKKFYKDCELRFSDCSEVDADEMLGMFCSFLVALSYHPNTVREAVLELADSYELDEKLKKE